MRASSWKLADTSPPQPDDQASIFTRQAGTDLEVDAGGLDKLAQSRLEQAVAKPHDSFSKKISFRFNIGMGLEGGQPSGEPLLSGATLDETTQYARLRSYSFGDAILSTHGLGVSGINGYLASHFRLNQDFSQLSSAFPSVYDSSFRQPLIRSAYGEVDQFFEHPRLRPLHFRAGRSFQYGLSVIQFDGATLGYDTPTLQASLFAGQRSKLYGIGGDSLVTGAKLRFDFFEWRKWPFVAFANFLRVGNHRHFKTGVSYRWNQDILLSSSLRSLDGALAHYDLSLRARISDVTTLSIQLSNRTRNDWSFGLLQKETPTTSSDPRRYLDIGPVLPRSLLNIRYGTVLLRNLDLLVQASGALDRRNSEQDEASGSSASYLEGGGGIEMHIRRSLRAGASLSTRHFFLQNTSPTPRIDGVADPLVASLGGTGVSSFWEGGVNAVYSPGAREFTANAEVYGRRYRFQSEYQDRNVTDLRTGGRFSLEGWTFDRMRLKAEYDLSFSKLAFAPELRGLKTLRVLVEGSF